MYLDVLCSIGQWAVFCPRSLSARMDSPKWGQGPMSTFQDSTVGQPRNDSPFVLSVGVLGTLRGRQGCGRGTRLNLFGQVSPALPWRTAATLQDDSAAPSPTRWLVEPTTRLAMFGHAVDKTKISITVLGPKVQHYRGPWTRGLGCRGSNPGPLRESRLGGRTRGRVPSSIKRRSHLPENVQAPTSGCLSV